MKKNSLREKFRVGFTLVRRFMFFFDPTPKDGKKSL